MAIVIDPSAILGLAMEDEEADYADAVLDAVKFEGGMVPSIFWYEVRNMFVVNERRNRISQEQTTDFLDALAKLPVKIAPIPPEKGVLDLARLYNLTVYDAAYLELAQRISVPLATLDRKLRQAATQSGVPLFREPGT